MRLLLALVSFFALAFAPMGSHLQAMAVAPDIHCAESEGHGPTKSKLTQDGTCCIAVPAAIAPGQTSAPLRMAMIIRDPTQTVSELITSSFEAEDPPPRS